MFSAGTQTGVHLFGVTGLFRCGFVMIMIAIVVFYSYFSVCEQLKEAEEDGLSGTESGEIVTGLHISFLKSEGAFPPFHPEKQNLRNKSLAHPQMVSQLKRILGSVQILPANTRSRRFRP